MDVYNGPYINFFRAGELPLTCFPTWTPALFRTLRYARMAPNVRGAPPRPVRSSFSLRQAGMMAMLHAAGPDFTYT